MMCITEILFIFVIPECVRKWKEHYRHEVEPTAAHSEIDNFESIALHTRMFAFLHKIGPVLLLEAIGIGCRWAYDCQIE